MTEQVETYTELLGWKQALENQLNRDIHPSRRKRLELAYRECREKLGEIPPTIPLPY